VQGVEKASAAGLIVVTSAGNFGQQKNGDEGYTGITSPGNAPSAITVGAADTFNTTSRADDRVAPYSSRGPSWFDAFAKPDVIAPGHQLVADTALDSYLYRLMLTGRMNGVKGQPLLALSGSSMAAGVTSGVVALIVDAHNKADYYRQKALTPNLVKAMLEFSAIPVVDADYLTQGAGEVNAAGAIALASAIDTGARPNAYWVHTSVPGFTVIGSHTLAWGKRIIYGGNVLTGDLLYVNKPVWSGNLAWDTNSVWDSSVATLLASNIVWADAATWAAEIVSADRVVGQIDGDNIVWGTADGDNIVWGTMDGDNIVWGTMDGDNIVWGTWDGDNIVWGTSDGDNIVWGTSTDGDNIVWGTSVGNNVLGGAALPPGIF